MDFLNNFSINSTSGFIGLALLVVGGFMILAGVGIISIQQVTVRQGRATWILGLLFAALGLYLFYPELNGASEITGPGGVSEVPNAAPGTEELPPMSEWRALNITLPGDGFWRETGPGVYTATGSTDTFAWSQQSFSGDLDLTLDIESPSENGEANIVVYGNGGGFSDGALIFTIANDLQQIVVDTIYDGGTKKFVQLKLVNFDSQVHTIRISILARKASLYLDGNLLASVFLDDGINTTGKIGLLKYWERPEVSFSNVRIRGSAAGD